MITPMSHYTFLLLTSDKDAFLEKIKQLGVVDIVRSSKNADEKSRSIIREIEELDSRVKCLQRGSDAHLEALLKEKDEASKEVEKSRPWGDFDRNALREFDIKFFCVSPKKFEENWKDRWALEEISRDKQNCYFVIAGDASGFPLKSIPEPQYTLSEAEERLRKLQAEIEDYRKVLEEEKKDISAMQERTRKLYSELDLHTSSLSSDQAAEGAITIFTGFAPTKGDEELCRELDAMSIYYEKRKATAEDNPPIVLKNNSFVKQFEPLTSMYGLPVYNEFDPTVFLSIFFLLFFAMCMGDAGYGLLLVAIGFALRGREGGLAKMWKLIITLGTGTFVVGLVMGAFFGIDLTAQSWVPGWMKRCMITGDVMLGSSTYSKQMILSLGIGIFHICLAMITKAVWAVKQSGFKNSLSTLGWTLLIVGAVVIVSTGLLGVISENAMKWTLIAVASVSALGIYIFNKWGRNPLVNIGSGLWDTYNMASGLMGDVLSYIRLYALGLSGGMLGQTFNLIADMVKGSDPTWQWIFYLLILLVGHTLNLALCCLGAFVHPLRLNFVEFFKNSAYQGQGSEYKPLK